MLAYREWTVLPHGPWQDLAENLLCIEGTLAGAMRGWPRTMTVVRRGDGTLVLHSAVALDEPSMARMEAWGRPEILVVPNGSHRTDAFVYARRYPGLRIYCPVNNRENVEKVAPVFGSYDDFPSDSAVRAQHLEGVNGWEGILHVHSKDGSTLIFGDVISWIRDMPEPAGSTATDWIGPEPMMAEMAKDELVRDAAALRSHLLRLAAIPDLVRIVPGHGEVIRKEPAAVLRKIAASL